MKIMEPIAKSIAEYPTDISHRDSNFIADVKRRSGENFDLCWHCQSCAGGCPFVSAMDYPPNRVIRLVQLRMKKEVLHSGIKRQGLSG